MLTNSVITEFNTFSLSSVFLFSSLIVSECLQYPDFSCVVLYRYVLTPLLIFLSISNFLLLYVKEHVFMGGHGYSLTPSDEYVMQWPCSISHRVYQSTDQTFWNRSLCNRKDILVFTKATDIHFREL